MWRAPGQEQGDPHYEDSRPELATDTVHWVDTDVMLADPLTKAMEADKLLEALDTNFWDLRQPIESVLKKRAKQLSRRKTKDVVKEDFHSVDNSDAE